MTTDPESRYFVGDTNELEGKTRGYLAGWFMAEKGYPQLNFGEVEIALMELPMEDSSKPHYHRVSTEVTIAISGCLHLILDQKEEVHLKAGEFIVIKPGTVLQNPLNEEGTKVVVVKFPSVPYDKFYTD